MAEKKQDCNTCGHLVDATYLVADYYCIYKKEQLERPIRCEGYYCNGTKTS